MVPAPQYLRGIRLKLGYFATWLPSEQIAVGDIGIVQDHLFTKMTSLSVQGIDFSASLGSEAETLTQLDGASVTVQIKAAGVADPSMSVPQAKAGIAFDFVGQKSFVFHAQGCRVRSINDLAGVESQIIEKYKDGGWDKPWHVVTHVVHADKTTVLVSESSGSRIEFSADGTLTAWTDLGTHANVAVAHERGSFTKFVGKQAMTPLLRTACLKARILGSRLLPAGLAPIDLITPKIAATDRELQLHLEEVRALDD